MSPPEMRNMLVVVVVFVFQTSLCIILLSLETVSSLTVIEYPND